jgi:hypothetical protein
MIGKITLFSSFSNFTDEILASFSKKQTHRHFHPKENRQYSPFVKNATKKRLYG